MPEDQIQSNSLNISELKLRQLKEILPEAFSEDRIDTDKLKIALGEQFFIKDEHYELSWAGKTDAFITLQQPTTATLAPVESESVNFDTTENIFIEGENLEVLKIMQKSYFGKIKMIYIDPPYNTGNDSFIYPDKFSESKDEYLKRIGSKDEEGYLTKDGFFRKNSKDNGHYHSNWLTMMYPRLYLARNLLRDDGVIFVSIDDNEVHNLRAVMNEIFGEENLLTQIIIRANSRGQTYKQIAKTHEYIIIYTKNINNELYELEKDEYNNDLTMVDDVSSYNLRELRNRNPKFGKHNRPNLFYPIYVNEKIFDNDGHHPVSLIRDADYNIEVLPMNSYGKESCWRWGKDRVSRNSSQDTLKCNIVAKMKGDGTYRIFEKYRKKTYKPKSIWDDNSFLTETGTTEIKDLGFGGLFDFPKPVGLIKQIVKLATNDEEEEIVLDFFSGSGTTAHAVLELNKEDGGNRKFICVQLPEKTDENSEAYKAGYKTIADIGKERIRRVILKIQKEITDKPELFNDKNIDLGLKAFKLKHSNFKLWRGDIIENEDDLKAQMDAFENPKMEGAREFNILYELMLKTGCTLSDKVETKENYYSVKDGELIVAAKAINESVIKNIISDKPKKVIILDELFENNDQLKTNTALQMKDAGIEFRTV